MFIRVPVTYWERGIRKGCRKTEDILCGEWVEVNAVEVTDLEAPVATRWKAQTHKASNYPNGLAETRWFDGRHFSPQTYSVVGEPTIHVDAERLLRDCENGHTYGNPLVGGGRGSDISDLVEGRLKSVEDMELRARYSNGRDNAIEEAHERASNVLLVRGDDGSCTVWTACEEPVYKVDDPRGRGDYIFVDVIGKGSIGSLHPNFGIFRADRFDDMQDHVRKLQERGASIASMPHIHVLVPESITYDDETPAFLAAVRSAVDWGKSQIAEKDIEEIVAWATLRDMLREADADCDNSPERLSTLESALQAYRDIRWANRDQRFSDYATEAMDNALERWRLRPLSLGHESVPMIGHGR